MKRDYLLVWNLEKRDLNSLIFINHDTKKRGKERAGEQDMGCLRGEPGEAAALSENPSWPCSSRGFILCSLQIF